MNDPFDCLLDQLFDRMREGKAEAEDFAELERQLLADAALRRRYRARVRMEEALSASFEEPAELVLPFGIEEKSPWYRRTLVTLTGIAAVVIAAIATLATTSLREPSVETVATLESRSADRWEGPLVLTGESRVPPGVVRLESGTARFRFDSGAFVTLEGPASLQIESPMKVRLLHGRALVEAPESAHGFTMGLPHGEAIDLGTKFSVSVEHDLATCEVLDGRVMMRHQTTQKEKLLDGGEAMTLDEQGISRLNYRPSLNFAPDDQKTVLMRSYAETTVVSLKNSRSTFTEKRSDFVDNRMLLVKMEAGSMAQRRALFNIDLRKARGKAIDSARLHLNLVPSGLGFAAYLPETITFAVYGITDESRENWSRDPLQWEDAPGYLGGDEAAVNTSEVTLLGKFAIERGRQSGPCKIETKALQEFLSQDTTGVAGFLVVRETFGTSNYSLVHAFASSRHPEDGGPCVEVILADEK